MAKSSIYPFAEQADAASILSDADYEADSQRGIGNQPGVARAAFVNKALRQAAALTAGLAAYIAARQGADITDALTSAEIEAYLDAALDSQYERLGQITQTELDGGDDLDNVTDPGWYYWGATAPAHAPAGGYSGLSVLIGQGDNRIQSVFDNNGTIWRRGNGGTNHPWHDWRRTINSADEGAGAGFNADQLDGEHGSYYRDANNLNRGTLPTGRLRGAYNIDISGRVTLPKNQYYHDNIRALDCNNSDIVGVNAIVCADEANSNGEGLLFPKQGAAGYSTNASDYYTLRAYRGTLYFDGHHVWHTGNDGAGSGLDADRLDGQHGSYYRDAGHLNRGTVPKARLSGKYSIDISGKADKAGYADNANNLDGHSSGYFARSGGDSGNYFQVHYSGTGSHDAVALGEFANNLSEKGYAKLPSGLIFQWGHYILNSDKQSWQTVNFPIRFPNHLLGAGGAPTGVVLSSNNQGIAITHEGTTSMQITADGTASGIYWQAIGY
jgi:hypothetical protein